jgi:putative Holliday junction resolvase
VIVTVAGTGRVLALDPGSSRVGVAVSDSARAMAFPRPALEAGERLTALVCALVEEEAATVVVVGLPKGLSGREGPAARSSRSLADELRGLLEVPVVLHDERLTTVQASQALSDAGHDQRSQRRLVDSAAATVLLESWLASA